MFRANIAEGAARGSPKEFARYLIIARASLAELDTLLILSRELGFVPNAKMDEVSRSLHLLLGALGTLIKTEHGFE